MLREIRDMGFEYAELSHGTRISLLPGIIEAVEAGEIKISSLHNFCPLPMGVTRASPNLYEFSAESERERELAVRHTIKTLDFAVRVRASLVVTHLGSIDMRDYTEKLLDMAARGLRETPAFRKLSAELSARRAARKSGFFDRVLAALGKILPEVQSRGLRLGAENRQELEELPLEEDFAPMIRELGSSALVYWHDTGHAQIKENLGFLDHYQHLASLAPQLGGFHLHDVQFPGRDHCAPGAGTIDFARLKPLVRPEHVKVFEFSPALSPDAARKGVDFIYSVWGSA
jgi:sugar phosphate isomerase/epimerase